MIPGWLITWLGSLPPVLAAVLAGLGTYLLTAIGTLPVLLFRQAPRWLMNLFSAVAAGVMVAASCWSLLVPSLERGGILPAVIGLVVGGGFMVAAGYWVRRQGLTLPGLGYAGRGEDAQRKHRPLNLMIAMTLHNFPEGLAIGVAFGASDLAGATALALGIGLQNIPEGLAIALPLRRHGMARSRAFFWGQLSAIVEPVAAVLGAWLVMTFTAVLPYGMAFAAGAMLHVTVTELLPEAVEEGRIQLAGLGFLAGFGVMMALDNAFTPG